MIRSRLFSNISSFAPTLSNKASAVGAVGVLLFSVVLVQCGAAGNGAAPSASEKSVSPAQAGAGEPGGFDHSDFDALLKRHVDAAGNVDYEALLADRSPLDLYIQRLGDVPSANFEAWPRDERLAFHINAYNAITLSRIIDDYPPRGSGLIWPKVSIKNISGVWKRIRNRVAGKEITLNDLEHEILRVDYDEPRIHFAIVCASVSCPQLQTDAYTADRLEEQLTAAAEGFARDRTKNRVDPAAGRGGISSIFDWFAEDFEPYKAEVPGAVNSSRKNKKFAGGLGFLAKYGPEDARDFLKSGDYKTDVLKYDWNLNAQ